MSAWARFRSAVSRLDMDDIFAYQTPKLVTIRDRRLGLLHLAFMVAIFIYIVVFVIIVQRGYLEREVPAAAVRTSFLEPASFTPPERLPYCAQAASADGKGRPNLPCVYWDSREAAYPPGGSNEIFITSRVTETREAPQPAGCLPAATQPECARRAAESVASYYVADIEDFTLLVDHGIVGYKTDVGDSTPTMRGRLKNWEGTVLKQFNDQSRPGDILTVRELLRAAEEKGVPLSLDDKSATATADSNESIRSDGLVLLVYIDYGNKGIAPNPEEVSYTYRVRAVRGKKFKTEEVVWAQYPAQRVIRNRHGILIAFKAVGEVGKFSFQAMLINLVTALGLMAVATTVTDYLALYLMPQKERYKEYKFQVTPDFSEIRDQMKAERREAEARRRALLDGRADALAAPGLEAAVVEPGVPYGFGVIGGPLPPASARVPMPTTPRPATPPAPGARPLQPVGGGRRSPAREEPELPPLPPPPSAAPTRPYVPFAYSPPRRDRPPSPPPRRPRWLG